jgi:hypothetical protein
VDVFYDASEALDDPSALADAPFAFARHALCTEPPGAGHAACARHDASAAAAAVAAEHAAEAEPMGKAAEVLELEALGKQFGDGECPVFAIAACVRVLTRVRYPFRISQTSGRDRARWRGAA